MSPGHMRLARVALMCLAAACSDASPPPPVAQSSLVPAALQQGAFVPPFAETPSLEAAVAFTAIPTDPPDTWLTRQTRDREAADYIAVIEMERPVSHHPYIYEQRRSSDWIATVWRRGDGSREELSYFNVRTGAGVGIQRNDVGEIYGVTIEQSDDFIDDRREPTEEHAVHLGEECTVWRTVPRPGLGFRALIESCVTGDGIELWTREIGINHPTRPDYVRPRMHVSSLRRGPVDPSLARPHSEWFEWSYWRARAAAIAADTTSTNAPPDHSIWYEEHRTAQRGRVILAQYRNNWRGELSHEWYERGNSHGYSLLAPGLRIDAQVSGGHSIRRSVNISVGPTPIRWRPDPSTVTRGESQTILGRRCHWLTPRNPPEDAFWRDCWTDDNYVLARTRHGRAGGSGEVAVRLEAAPRDTPQPPPEIFNWALQVTS
jgi:hypothetical protein